MGTRFRKSVNLGGGARINISKSGIGYSVGTKGARVTMTADGRTRTTLSIPNTGISYVNETGTRKKRKQKIEALEYDRISNGGLENMKTLPVTEESTKIQDKIGILIMINTFTIIGAIGGMIFAPLIILAIVGILLYIFMLKRRIEVKPNKEMGEKLDQFFSSKKNWYIDKIFVMDDVLEKKNGFPMILSRQKVKYKKRKSFFDYIKSDEAIPCISISSGKYSFCDAKLYFLDSGVLIIYNNEARIVECKYQVEALSYLEDEKGISDAKEIGQRYQFRNKDGSPNKRYKNNPMLTAYSYGALSISSGDFDVLLVTSNVDNISKLKELQSNDEDSEV